MEKWSNGKRKINVDSHKHTHTTSNDSICHCVQMANYSAAQCIQSWFSIRFKAFAYCVYRFLVTLNFFLHHLNPNERSIWIKKIDVCALKRGTAFRIIIILEFFFLSSSIFIYISNANHIQPRSSFIFWVYYYIFVFFSLYLITYARYNEYNIFMGLCLFAFYRKNHSFLNVEKWLLRKKNQMSNEKPKKWYFSCKFKFDTLNSHFGAFFATK